MAAEAREKGVVRWEGCSPARLHPSLLSAVESFAASSGLVCRITATERTDDEAEEIYSWGRTKVNPHTGPLPGQPLGLQASNAKTSSQTAHGLKEDGFAHAVDLHPVPPTSANARAWANHLRARGLKAGEDFLVGGKPDFPHGETLEWRSLRPLPRELQGGSGVGLLVALAVGAIAWLTR